MSFNLSVSMIKKFTKEATIYVHFKSTKYGSFDLRHITKLDISNAGLVSAWCEEKYICSFIIDEVLTLSYILADKTSDDEKYIIYDGEFV